MRVHSRVKIIIASTIVLHGQCASLATEGHSSVDLLSREIVEKEIEWAKSNAEMELDILPKQKYKNRWLTTGMMNNSLTSTGAYMNSAINLDRIERPGNIPRRVVASAGMTRGIANFVTTTECSLEFGLDLHHYIHNWLSGRDLGHVTVKAKRLKGEIDALIQKRTTAIATNSDEGGSSRCIALETRVLQDLENTECAEFAYLYGQAKRVRSAKFLTQLMAFSSNLESGILTFFGVYSAYAIRGSLNWRLEMGSSAGIGDIIGGGINACAPFFVRISSRLLGRAGRKKASGIFATSPAIDPTILLADRQELAALLKSEGESKCDHDISVSKSFALAEADIITELQAMHNREARHDHINFLETMVSEPGGAATKIVNGIGTVVGDLDINKNTRYKTDWIGGTAAVYGAGNSLALAVNTQRMIRENLRIHNLRMQGQSPEQVLKKHIQQLADLHASLNNSINKSK